MAWIIGALLGLLLQRQERVEELKVENFRLQLRQELTDGIMVGLIEELDTYEERQEAKDGHPAWKGSLVRTCITCGSEFAYGESCPSYTLGVHPDRFPHGM